MHSISDMKTSVCQSWAKLQQLRFQPQIVPYVLFATEPFIGLWAKFHITIFACGKIHALWDLGCFPLCQTDRLETSGTNQGKMEWHCLVETNSQPDRSVPFMFRPKFQLLLSEVGLEMSIFEHGTASFSQTRPTGQRGPSLEVDHFFQKISTWTEVFHLCFDWNFRKF